MDYTTPSARAARAVRALLHDREETQERLSAGTGIALSTLKRRMLGATPFTIDELFAIAQYFRVPIAGVLAPANERGSPPLRG